MAGISQQMNSSLTNDWAWPIDRIWTRVVTSGRRRERILAADNMVVGFYDLSVDAIMNCQACSRRVVSLASALV